MATCQELDERDTTHNEDGSRTHTRKFRVKLDSPSSSGVAALQASGLPPHYSLHPEDAGALLIRRRPHYVADSYDMWDVDLEYNTKLSVAIAKITPEGGLTGEHSSPSEMANDNPFQQPPEIEFDGTPYQEVLVHDHVGKVVETSAGEKYDPPLMWERDLLTLHLTRNLPFFNPSLISTLKGCANSVPFLGFQRGEVLLQKLKSKVKYWNSHPYWEVAASFVFNPFEEVAAGPPKKYVGGWVVRLLDAGVYEGDDSQSLGMRRIVDERGQLASKPILLDGGGQVLAQGGTPVYNEFQKWPFKELQAIGIV